MGSRMLGDGRVIGQVQLLGLKPGWEMVFVGCKLLAIRATKENA